MPSLYYKVIVSKSKTKMYTFECTYHVRDILYDGVIILLTKTTAAQNEGVLSYLRVRGLYFLAVVFVSTIIHSMIFIFFIHIH